MDATDLLRDVRLLPVIVIEDAALAPELARTLQRAGVGAVEITLRTTAALDAIRAMKDAAPDLLVGAGSIRSPEDFARVTAAGGQFAVSPGATPRLADAATMPWVAGASTPSECLALLERGYRLQKFFPAEQNGGVAALKAISGPIPEVSFCPTGGVNPNNAQAYLALPNVVCVGGSWFVPGDLLAAGDFETIAARTREAVRLTSP